jgi:hypothetical protein
MIVSVRGTGGSGKSYIARQVMARYDVQKPIYTSGRKRPFGYRCTAEGHAALWVPGHYETACGGGDTITNVSDVFDSVNDLANEGMDVLFEGIISQDDVVRTADLHRRHKLLVIYLDVPIDVCLASIQARRDARGDAKPLNPKNTVNRLKSLASNFSRLKDAGVDVRKLGRDEALSAALEALGWA